MFGSNNNYNRAQNIGGGELSRQISQSLANPYNTAEYMEQVLGQARYESGWLEMLNTSTRTWENRYFVFEKEVIKHSKYSEEQQDLMKVQQYQANFNNRDQNQSKGIGLGLGLGSSSSLSKSISIQQKEQKEIENKSKDIDDVVEIPIRNIVSFRAQSTISNGATYSSLVVSIKRNDREEKLQLRAKSQDEMNKWQFALHKTVAILFPKLVESRKLKLQQQKLKQNQQSIMYKSDITHSQSSKGGGGFRHNSGVGGGSVRERSRSMEFDGDLSELKLLDSYSQSNTNSNSNSMCNLNLNHSSNNSFDNGDGEYYSGSDLNSTNMIGHRGRGGDVGDIPSGIDAVSPNKLEEFECLGFGHGRRHRRKKFDLHLDAGAGAGAGAGIPYDSGLGSGGSAEGGCEGGRGLSVSLIGGHAFGTMNTMTSIDSVSTTIHKHTHHSHGTESGSGSAGLSVSQYASPTYSNGSNGSGLGLVSAYNSYSSHGTGSGSGIGSGTGSRSGLRNYSQTSPLMGNNAHASGNTQYLSKSIPINQSHMAGLAGSFGGAFPIGLSDTMDREQTKAHQLQLQQDQMIQQQQEVNNRNHQRRRASKSTSASISASSVVDEMDMIFTDTGPLNDEDIMLENVEHAENVLDEDSYSTVSGASSSSSTGGRSRGVSLEDSSDGMFNFDPDGSSGSVSGSNTNTNSQTSSPNRSPRTHKKSPESRGVPMVIPSQYHHHTDQHFNPNLNSNANPLYGYSSSHNSHPIPVMSSSISSSIPIPSNINTSNSSGSGTGSSSGQMQSVAGLSNSSSVLSSSLKNESIYLPNKHGNRYSPVISPSISNSKANTVNTHTSPPLLHPGSGTGVTPPMNAMPAMSGSSNSKRRSSDAAMKLLSQWGGIGESDSSTTAGIGLSGMGRQNTVVNWHVGACSKRGKRSANEDRYCVIPDFPDELEMEAEYIEQKSSNANVKRRISKHQRLQALVEKCPCKVNMEEIVEESEEHEYRRRVSSDHSIGSNGSNFSNFSIQSSVSLSQMKTVIPVAGLNATIGSGGVVTEAFTEEVEVVGRVGASKRHLYSHALNEKNKDKNDQDGNSNNHIGGISREGYFAVYDGHCGDYAAIHCANNLHLAIARHPSFATDLDVAIHETCVAFDKEIVDYSRASETSPGTTAVGLFIRGQRCSMFNIGDSSAVICSSGVARELTEGHKPGRENELDRIKRANGWITEEKELYLARLHQMDLTDPLIQQYAEQMTWVTIHRVCGEIAVARSIGDADYKAIPVNVKLPDELFFWPLDHSQILYDDVVIPDPEIISFNISQDDEYIVLASDGLWDVVTPDLAIKRINDQLALRQQILNNGTGRDADGLPPLSYDEIAQDLCELAIRLGSSDNVTIIILLFEHD